MKKQFGIAMVALTAAMAFTFSACGDDSTSAKEPSKVSKAEDLSKDCEDGEEALVGDKEVLYTCKDGKWETEEAAKSSASKPKSSSSKVEDSDEDECDEEFENCDEEEEEEVKSSSSKKKSKSSASSGDDSGSGSGSGSGEGGSGEGGEGGSGEGGESGPGEGSEVGAIKALVLDTEALENIAIDTLYNGTTYLSLFMDYNSSATIKLKVNPDATDKNPSVVWTVANDKNLTYESSNTLSITVKNTSKTIFARRGTTFTAKVGEVTAKFEIYILPSHVKRVLEDTKNFTFFGGGYKVSEASTNPSEVGLRLTEKPDFTFTDDFLKEKFGSRTFTKGTETWYADNSNNYVVTKESDGSVYLYPFRAMEDRSAVWSGKAKNYYATARVGNQMWMAEYLQNATYAESEGLALCASGTQYVDFKGKYNDYCNDGAIVYYSLAGLISDAKIASSVSHICPIGWKVPTTEDIKALVKFASANDLKTTTGWTSGNSGDDSYGFALTPVGYLYKSSSSYSRYNYTAAYIAVQPASSEETTLQYYYLNSTTFNSGSSSGESYYPVRCIKAE